MGLNGSQYVNSSSMTTERSGVSTGRLVVSTHLLVLSEFMMRSIAGIVVTLQPLTASLIDELWC
jgi:hypothetical protein